MSELLAHSEPPRCADSSNVLEMSQMASEPVSHYGVCTSLLEPRRVHPTLLLYGQPAQLGANPAPAPGSRYFDPTKSSVFVTPAAFVVPSWNQHDEEIKSLLIAPTRQTRWVSAFNTRRSRR
ncbi:hypothetical protein Y032_0119g800 [Ancylostoma ceylanicum]|uniref:Uncharacterized protein n=1 Tax=Ancylostoma ceylanicum TaxID=53326 RepID=A0A016TB37_9BILA|nr:hypothetical protein Y032_0119g800 [Ancylostoma ceylanicum]